MARELTRTKPTDTDQEDNPGGVDQFAGRERVTKETEAPIQPGWSANRRTQANRGDRPVRFTVPDDGEEVLIAFLQEEPFASFFQHWVKTDDKKRKPYICIGEKCPLCARADVPKPQDWFNVVELVNPGVTDKDKNIQLPRLALWYCSADPAKAIKERSDTKRTSPINKDGLYFAVSKRTGKNGFNTYSVDPIREDELQGEWGVEPLTAEQKAAFLEKAYTSELIKPNTKMELQEVADDYFGD